MEIEHWFFGSVIALIFSITASVVVCNINDNATMAKMVKDGVNPITAQCAVRGVTTNNREVCIAATSAAK